MLMSITWTRQCHAVIDLRGGGTASVMVTAFAAPLEEGRQHVVLVLLKVVLQRRQHHARQITALPLLTVSHKMVMRINTRHSEGPAGYSHDVYVLIISATVHLVAKTQAGQLAGY